MKSDSQNDLNGLHTRFDHCHLGLFFIGIKEADSQNSLHFAVAVFNPRPKPTPPPGLLGVMVLIVFHYFACQSSSGQSCKFIRRSYEIAAHFCQFRKGTAAAPLQPEWIVDLQNDFLCYSPVHWKQLLEVWNYQVYQYTVCLLNQGYLKIASYV